MNNLKYILLLLSFITLAISCGDDDDVSSTDFSGVYSQEDQMGRPAINTVFIPASEKDNFNTTLPADQAAAYEATIEAGLVALSPAYANAGDANALGFTAPAFANVLATDVLSVSLDGPTTFFDGTNVLTGRNLSDDVISTELLLIFGGEDGTENPGLSDDNVDANDRTFLTSFPYLAAPF
jgi:hypothetical protein